MKPSPFISYNEKVHLNFSSAEPRDSIDKPCTNSCRNERKRKSRVKKWLRNVGWGDKNRSMHESDSCAADVRAQCRGKSLLVSVLNVRISRWPSSVCHLNRLRNEIASRASIEPRDDKLFYIRFVICSIRVWSFPSAAERARGGRKSANKLRT